MKVRASSLGAFVLLCVHLVFSACPNTAGFTRFATQSSWNVVGSNVTIPAGAKILIDQSIPRLYSLTINGAVVIANANIQINTTFIKINDGGSLTAGSDDCPITNKLIFTFIGPKQADGEIGKDVDNTVMGSKGLAVLIGGSLQLFGWKSGPSWTRLAETAKVNATTIKLEEGVQWKVGQQIVIATTDFGEVFDYRNTPDPGPYNIWRGQSFPDQNEMRTISSIDATGKVITFDQPLNFMHWGAGFEKAEVGLLTRQIVLQGEESSVGTGFGGHLMMRKGLKLSLSGIEVTRMGQQGVLARYPIHFHNAREVYGMNFTLLDSSIHHNFQRCLTIHETHGLIVKDNVAFDTYGHCYFLEDGGERGNLLQHNLGIRARPTGFTTTNNIQLIPSDIKPSIFWITNPNNTFIRNAAVGGWFGYWFALPVQPVNLGGTFYPPNDPYVRPRFTPLAGFDDNVAHSASDTGLEIDTFLNADGTVSEFSGAYTPKLPPYNRTDDYYPALMAHFKRFTAYKCREFGVWGEGGMHWSELQLGDNGQAFMVNGQTLLENSVIIGESDNIGTPTKESGLNRTLPNRWNSLDVLIGHSGYDNGAPQFSRNNTFINFVSTPNRPAASFAVLRNGPFVLPPKNQLMMNTYINANEIFFRYLPNYQIDNEFGAVILDVDGTTTGVKEGAWIVSNNTMALRPDCVYRPEWQGNVCPITRDTYVKMRFDDMSGGYSLNYNGSPQNTVQLTNKIFRTAWYNLGSTLQDGYFMGGNRLGTSYVNGLNVLTGRGYTVRFIYSNSTEISQSKWLDTPSRLTIAFEGLGSGDWIVAAVPYPAGTTFTIDSTSYPYVSYTKVSSMSQLAPNTYYWDATSCHLFVVFLDTNNGAYPNFWWGITLFYDYASILIQASCNPCSPDASKLAQIPAAPEISFGSDEETYEATLENCQIIGNKASSGANGKAFFKFYKNMVGNTAQLVYNIYHNAMGARRIRLMRGDVGSDGQVVGTRNITGVTSGTKGIFALTRQQWQDLATGKLYISVEGATSDVRYLRGQVLCTSPGKCSLPHGGAIVCDPTYDVMPIYTDYVWNGTFNSKEQKNQTLSINATSDKACGAKSIRTTWPHFIGFELPWGNYLVNVTKWKSLEFYIRLAPGEGEMGNFFIQCGGPNATLNGWVSISDGAVLMKPEYIQNLVIDDSGWTFVRIPLSDLGFTQSRQLSSLYFFTWGTSTYKDTYIDEIRFSTEVSSIFSAPSTGAVASYSDNLCTSEVPDGGDGESDEESSAARLSFGLTLALVCLLLLL